MARVILVAEPGDWNFASSLARGFTSAGWAVTRLDWGGWTPRTLARVAYRVTAAAWPFRQRLLRALRAASIDDASLVLVVKGALLDRKTIEEMRRAVRAPVVCWNPDSPFDAAISNRGAGIPAAVPSYDAYVTWSPSLADRLASSRSDVHVIPFGVDLEEHRPETGSGRWAGRLAFIGTFTAERARLLERLRPWDPVVFGNDWPDLEGVEVRPEVLGGEFRRVVGEAAWNLNMLRPQNADSHNMRSFEIPGCGGQQLAPWTVDHERYLADSASVLYHDVDELLSLLDGVESPDLTTRPGWREANSYAERVRELLKALRIVT